MTDPEGGGQDDDGDDELDLREVLEEVIELLDPPITREGAAPPPR